MNPSISQHMNPYISCFTLIKKIRAKLILIFCRSHQYEVLLLALKYKFPNLEFGSAQSWKHINVADPDVRSKINTRSRSSIISYPGIINKQNIKTCCWPRYVFSRALVCRSSLCLWLTIITTTTRAEEPEEAGCFWPLGAGAEAARKKPGADCEFGALYRLLEDGNLKPIEKKTRSQSRSIIKLGARTALRRISLCFSSVHYVHFGKLSSLICIIYLYIFILKMGICRNERNVWKWKFRVWSPVPAPRRWNAQGNCTFL